MEIFYLLLQIFIATNAFDPMFIGEPFRQDSFLTDSEDDHAASICGTQRDYYPTEYPWAVSITLGNGQNRLGGSVISPYHILTVAHGFLEIGNNPDFSCRNSSYRRIDEIRENRLVWYGGKCIRGHSTMFPNNPECPIRDGYLNRIRSVLVDGDFRRHGCRNGHDWAIIELESRIRFNDRVKPICLPFQHKRMKLDDVLRVPTWGRSNIFEHGDPLMHVVPMRIDRQCRKPNNDKMPSHVKDLICAVSLNTTDYFQPRVCHGHSGSGMEQRDSNGRAVLVGLTSFGTGNCPANELARFTRIDLYLDDICDFTGVCYMIE